MENAIARAFHSRPTVLIFIGVLGVLAACLAVEASHLDPDTFDPRASLDDLEVKLLRYSTHCDSKASAPLVAKVGDGCEFPGDEVKTLGSSCAPSPRVDVHVEERHVIFDFSNVAEPGGFTRPDFDGYIIDVLRPKGGPAIVGMYVDDDMTTVDIDSVTLSHDYDQLEVNFQDVSYDHDSFVKISLWLVNMELRADDVQ